MRTERVATVVPLLVAIGAWLVPVSASASPPFLIVQAENARGTLQCRAEYLPEDLRPGYPIEISLGVINRSSRPQTIGTRGYLLIRPVGGHFVWSTDPYVGGGDVPDRRIGPGRFDDIRAGVTTRVRWSGPLEIRPVCPGTGAKMPWIAFDVAVPEPPPSVADAIASAAAYPGSPWGDCVPATSGSVEGELVPPDGAPSPPLTVRCWADIRHEDGFDVVALSMVSPADAPDFSIPEPADVDEAFFAGGDLPGDDAMLAMRWSFVVTAEGARPVLFQMRERIVGTGETPSYTLKDGMWSTSRFATPCGVSTFGFGPTGRALFFDWYTACDASGAAIAKSAPRRVLLG